MRGRKAADKIIQVGGREFFLYKVYDKVSDEYILDYPNFQENPVYTAEGRPFALSVQEGCLRGKPYNPDDIFPYDCSECTFFHLEAPADAIGICKNDLLRRKTSSEINKK